MKGWYFSGCALLGALAPAVHADLIGNPLVPGTDASDTGSYVYNVYYGSPMPSNGTVDAISIYQMDTSFLPQICDSFTLRLLHYTGVGDVYEQYYTSQVFGIYGPVDAVQTYWLGDEVPVQAGDLFVTYGQAIPFTADKSALDTYYYTGSDFAPADTGLIELGDQTYTGNRFYSAAVDFNPIAGPALASPEPASAAMMAAGTAFLLIRRKPATSRRT